MENIDAYIFNFDAEADRLQRELGLRARPLAFVSIDSARNEVGRVVCGGMVYEQDLHQRLARERAEGLGLGARMDKCVPPYGIGPYFAVRMDAGDSPVLAAADEDVGRLLTLTHETGHALHMAERGGQKSKLWYECAADAYAALKALQRFGNAAMPALRRQSWARTWRFVSGIEEDHLSSPVLDRIVAEAQAQDLTGLTEDEILTRSMAYADVWTPQARLVDEAGALFRRENGAAGDKGARLRMLSATALSAENPLLFYTAAKALLPFAGTGVRMHGARRNKTYRMTGPRAAQARAAIDSRARGRGLFALTEAFAAGVDTAPEDTPLALVLQPPRVKNRGPLPYVR